MTNGKDPVVGYNYVETDEGFDCDSRTPSLTKREYFAAMRRGEMYGDQTLSANWAETITGKKPPADKLENIKWWIEAEEIFSVMRADALIKALNK
jgi:hypothetical protein